MDSDENGLSQSECRIHRKKPSTKRNDGRFIRFVSLFPVSFSRFEKKNFNNKKITIYSQVLVRPHRERTVAEVLSTALCLRPQAYSRPLAQFFLHEPPAQ